MKKSILLFGAILIANLATAQQWTGTNTTTANISRTGSVGIGITAPTTARLEIKSVNNADAGLKFTNLPYSVNVNPPVLASFNGPLIQETIYNPIDKVLTVDSVGNVRLAQGGSVFSRDGFLTSERRVALNSFGFGFVNGNPFKTILNDDGLNGMFLFYINNDGKVGVGTNYFPTTAGSVNVSNYKLFVTGGILTEEVRVALGSTWADFVFAKDYKLPSLQEVETHIKEKGHLANVPSAAEVKANGIEVGEMAKIQMAKIEELTLYIIEQNKELQQQNKEIELLKTQMKTILEKK